VWSFRSNRLLEPVDVTVANLMAALGRYQGRQELFEHQAPQVLETLCQIAMVESTEASNRIEGIVVSPARLRALMAEASPRTRPEGEIAGYRDVLARIHAGQIGLPLTTDKIRAIHADMYAYLPGEGGTWKEQNNIIRQILPDGREVVRFVPLPANETPAAMDELCDSLVAAWESEQVDRLLVTNAFILDFLCIHPFPDGNGRAARLLTLLLLYAAGYEVWRYISLERIIENTKETYYEALRLSGLRWESGQHDLTPWHQYSLGVLVYAYREFEERVGEVVTASGGKRQIARAAIGRLADEFSVSELRRVCPTVSRATIRQVLVEMKEAGEIELVQTGRYARWRKL
jgi:Fic family protein